PEIPQTTVDLTVKTVDREGRTYRDYRDTLVEQIALAVFNERMGEKVRTADAPFLAAGGGKRRLTPITVTYTVGAAAKEGRVQDAFDVLLTEVARMRQLGVSAAELERARKRLLASYETYQKEQNKTASRTHAEELVRVFTTGEAAPGVELESQIARELLEGISKEDIDRFAQSWLPEQGRVVTVVMPQKPGLTPPSETELRATIETAEQRRFVESDETLVERPLLPTEPTPGTIVARERVDSVGVERWTLGNGMTVLIKSTDFKEDQVLLSAVSYGGTLKASDADYPSARAASAIAAMSGLGDFGAVELGKMLAGTRVSSASAVAEQAETVSGSSSVEDLETLFQLTHQLPVAIGKP
ncbi:MAG: hypothetical protein AAFQ82_27880, partial [Myxococcota bacterium]